MDLIDAIRGRRSVRDFSEAPVSEVTLAGLIEAAIQAPNAMNRQAWRFVVVTDKAALKSIAGQAKAHLLAELQRTPALEHFREHLLRPEYDIFYDAPALVVICTAASDDMAGHDCCLAAENLMLAAHAEGLGSCWIGFSEAWLATPDARSELGLPEDVRPVAPIIVGHPRAHPPPPGRRPAEISWIRA